jgi:hypothetical protein
MLKNSKGKVYLVATQDIEPDTELFWNYGEEY